MFKDYYHILEIPFDATDEQLKSAFRKQALKWHPDRNPNIDAKAKMQDINEAYLILKDAEARFRYDVEYQIYQTYKKSKTQPKPSTPDDSNEYEIHDDILKRWISNARVQASNLASQTLKEINIGAKAAFGEMSKLFITFLILGVVFFIISRSCQ